jgi:type I restriction enzyme S subunit
MNWGGDILALSANNVQMGRIDRTKEAYYGSGELYARWMTNGDCEYGDILMTMEAPLGNIAQINTNDKYILSQRVILIRPVKTVEKNYLAWFMKFDYFQNQLNINSSGSTAKGIQRSKLSKIKIYLPRIQDEQKAIATALSDVDNLITSLEQLIEKKKAIKQGTMQELLTGRRRLKGFGDGKGYKQTELGMIPEDWEVVSIKELFTVTAGGDVNRNLFSNLKDYTHQFPIFSNSISEKGLYGFSSEYQNEADSITVSARGTIGKAFYRSLRFTAIGRLLVLHPKVEIDCYYMTEYINAMVLFTSEVTGVPQLTAPKIAEIQIIIPSVFDEQNAIAKVLVAIDTEIENLETKVDKYKQIKQGMMQNLLTGRIRLV